MPASERRRAAASMRPGRAGGARIGAPSVPRVHLHATLGRRRPSRVRVLLAGGDAPLICGSVCGFSSGFHRFRKLTAANVLRLMMLGAVCALTAVAAGAPPAKPNVS